MKPITKSPSYLIRNPYSHCLRMVVPTGLRRLVGEKELRHSFKAGYLGVVKHKARFLAGQVQLIFNSLGRADTILSKLSDDQIQRLVQQHIKQSIETLLEKNGINGIDKSSMRYRKLCAEIHKAEIRLIPIQKKHLLCDFSYKEELSKLFPEVFPKAVANAPNTIRTHLREIINI